MSFSDRLRQARKRQGLTQEELGKKSGLSTYTIQRYEYGKLNPKKDTVAKLAAALNLFTFHNVSINSSFFIKLLFTASPFTFHNVSINSSIPPWSFCLYPDLHSTMFLLIPVT